MNEIIAFKAENGQEYHDRLEREFWEELHPITRAVALEQSKWMKQEFGSVMVVTCIGRTVEENKGVGGRPKSAHITFRALDFRSNHLNVMQKGPVIARIKKNWPIPMIHALLHTAGTGEHFHMNVNRAYA